jgi:hypothetical protein
MIRNTFDRGPEGWCSYDYHWSIVAGGRNIFVLAAWEGTGGVGGSGYVWTDEKQWSADIPESPVSVLAFIWYAHWVGLEPLDLRGATVSVHLRGDDLQLFGSPCYFWVNRPGCRWHLTGRPLTISDGEWAKEPNVFTLPDDESLWHRSWAGTPPRPQALTDVLAEVHSYGFSFVGFGQEPRGRFCMDQFEIRLAGE